MRSVGYAVMPVLAYLDESENDGGVYCVAGYVFEKKRYEALEPLWAAVLDEYGLTHFHMIDCAHGLHEFARLSKPQRVACQTKVMDLLKAHAEFGISVTMDMTVEQMFARAKLHGAGDLDAHVVCAYFALDRMATWSKRLEIDTPTHYFFEDGASGQIAVNRLLYGLFKDSPLVRERMRYAGHSFVSKRDAVGVQCADILAWQGAKDRKSQREARQRRADFSSLLSVGTYAVHIDTKLATQLLRRLRRQERQVEEVKRACYARLVKVFPSGDWLLLAAKG